MTETEQDDLSFVREMTEAGRNAPLLGGRFYLFWGVLVSVAYVGQWAVLDGRFGLEPQTIGFIWISFGVVAGIGMPLLIRSLKNKPGRGAMNNRVETAVWVMSGFAMFSFVVGVFVATAVFGKPIWLWDFVATIAFAGYGVSLFTSGSIAGVAWMRIPSVIALVSAGIVPILVATPELYLFGATVIIAVAVVPGFLLVMGEPKSLPEEA
ncbi:MAG: hypothetical protein AAF830_09830 [Pseudomonadota bacterium]